MLKTDKRNRSYEIFFFIFCEYYETNKLSKHFFHNFEKSVNIMYKISCWGLPSLPNHSDTPVILTKNASITFSKGKISLETVQRGSFDHHGFYCENCNSCNSCVRQVYFFSDSKNLSVWLAIYCKQESKEKTLTSPLLKVK